ncbi:hypothetical protein [Kribbella sp. NPDC023855]|uniref:hypothetical protein n=1 Tax=Kribbella sp. NPDC023855 TaxID=3154698 RepID=UPI0033F29781
MEGSAAAVGGDQVAVAEYAMGSLTAPAVIPQRVARSEVEVFCEGCADRQELVGGVPTRDAQRPVE